MGKGLQNMKSVCVILPKCFRRLSPFHKVTDYCWCEQVAKLPIKNDSIAQW